MKPKLQIVNEGEKSVSWTEFNENLNDYGYQN